VRACRFEPFQQPRQGFLTVLEELPGIMHHEDVTDVLVVSARGVNACLR
jgi:hypothetical protein